MRFSEFKIIKEATEQKQFCTVGDSHAHAVGQMGGKDWLNLAVGGASSKGNHPIIQKMLSNISQVPKGSVVLISLGANDTANAMTAGKPSRTAASIAADVAGVVDKVRAQGPSKIVFLLFPNGPGRGSKDAKFYGGEFQDEVRAAIKSAVGNVEIIDINGKPLTDGVHAGMSTYKEVANQVRAKGGTGVTLGPSSAEPGAPATKDKEGAGTRPSTGELDVPSGRQGPAVRDVQQALIALGYKLPQHGADGIRGPETVAAVKEFQQANNLTVDGDPGPETVGALNKLIATKGIKITKSTQKDVKQVDYSKDAADLDELTSDENVKAGKKIADKFLGREMEDKEWNYLLRATCAEASNNSEEQALVMAVILNRTRSGKWGNSVISVLRAPNQFQAVTGTSVDGHQPSANFTRGPTPRQMASILKGIKEHLPSAPKDIQRFTAANRAAYGPGTNVGYLDKLKADGGVQVGGTIFA